MSEMDSGVDYQGEEEPPDGLYQYERTVNKRVPTIQDVTEEDLGFFQEYGYLVIEEFLDEGEIESVTEGMVSLMARAHSGDSEFDLPDFVQFEDDLDSEFDDPSELSPEKLQYYVRKYMWYSEYSDEMRAPSERGDLRELISTIVDGQPEMFQDMALIKPPGGREKPWHQDKAYFDVGLDAPVVGVWIALDEATPENGCMHVIPGSHRDGPVVHFSRRDWQICDTDVQVDKDVMVPLDAGGALLFDGLIHHGTPPNTSDTLRRALQFHYTAADTDWLDERPDAFGNADADVEC